jgi:hypothetical protein
LDKHTIYRPPYYARVNGPLITFATKLFGKKVDLENLSLVERNPKIALE